MRVQVHIDLPMESPLPRLQPPHWCVAFSPSSAYVAVSQWSGTIFLFHTGQPATTEEGDGADTQAAADPHTPACIIPASPGTSPPAS